MPRKPLAYFLLLLFTQMIFSPGVLAEGETTLDLSSQNRDMSATLPAGSAPVAINLAGSTRTIESGAAITAAEHVAVTQVLNGGAQSIQLNAAGAAVGGTFTLGSALAQQIHNLVIPQGVTAVRDFAADHALNLAGNLVNAGTLYAVSTSQAVTTASIAAAAVNNNVGGLITSVLPAGGLAGYSNAIANLNLSLSAIGNIVNAGTISSAGHLNLTAGGSIINALPTGAAAALPLMQAAGSVNLASAAGNVVNSGIITALTNSINITSQAALTINNSGGALQALAGAVNVRDALFADKANLTFTGGDVLSRELNLYSGNGKVLLDLQNVTGSVNIYAGEAHVTAATKTLQLGTIALLGDPTFYNQGDLYLPNTITMAAGHPNLAFVASGSIFAPLSGAAPNIDTSGASGGSITMVAGANFEGGVVTPPQQDNDQASTITIRQSLNPGGGSSTGGRIDLTAGSGIAGFTSAATANGGSGGNVTLVAYAGSDAGSGTITLPANLTISTSGLGGGANGNVQVIAGAAAGTGITLGGINTTGGSGGSGRIQINTAKPTVPGVGISIQDGTVTGAFQADSQILPAAVVLGSATASIRSASTITISGGAITVSGAMDAPTTGASVSLTGSRLTIDSTIHAGTDGSINLTPSTAANIAVGDSTKNFAPFDITAAELNRLSVDGRNGSVIINGVAGASTTITGDFSYGGARNLTFTTATGDFIGSGRTITLVPGPHGNTVLSFNTGGTAYIGNVVNGSCVCGYYNRVEFTGDIGTPGLLFVGRAPGGIVIQPGKVLSARNINFLDNTVPLFVNDGNLTTSGQFVWRNNNGPITFQGSGSLSAGVPGVIIEANGGAATITGGPQISALGSVSIRGATGVSIGTAGGSPVSISAGQLAAGLNPRSTNMADYDFSKILNPGSITVTAVTGPVTIRDRVSMLSVGNNISIVSPQSIAVGTSVTSASSLFAQGAFLTVTALGNVSVNGSSLTSVARFLPGGGTVVIDGEDIPAFTGGAVGVTSDGPYIPNYTTFLYNLNFTRTGAGFNNAGGNGSQVGGGIIDVSLSSLTPGPATTFNVNGGTLSIDPPAVNSSVFLGIAPPLTAPPPPPTPTPAPSQEPASSRPFAGLLAFAPPSTSIDVSLGSKIATDTTQIPTDAEPVILQQPLVRGGCGLVAGGVTFQHMFDSSEVSRLNAQGIRLGPGTTGNFLMVEDGNILLAPEKPIVVGLGLGVLYMAPGSIAFIMRRGDNAVIYDLHQERPGEVKVVSSGRIITLMPGRQLVLTREDTHDFERVSTHCRCISYRRSKEQDLDDGIRAFAMDFSIPSALTTVQPLRHMLKNHTSASRRVTDKLLKNAVLLTELTYARGVYKSAH